MEYINYVDILSKPKDVNYKNCKSIILFEYIDRKENVYIEGKIHMNYIVEDKDKAKRIAENYLKNIK